MVLEVQAAESGKDRNCYPLEPGVFTIGRGPNNKIQINHPTISQVHAEFRIEPGRILVSDKNSTNGVFFKGRRISSFTAGPGDVFLLGQIEIRVSESEESEKNLLTPEIRARLHSELIDKMNKSRQALTQMSRETLESKTGEIARELLFAQFGEKGEAYVSDLLSDVLGLGPLDILLADDSVTEIMVNGPSMVYVEKGGKLYLSDRTFLNDQHVRDVIERIVLPLGRRIDESSPIVDARLKDGSRVNAIIPPLALSGPTITIRKFSKRKLVPDDLLKFNSASSEMIEYLRMAVRQRKNILISGGTGSGKTTLLNILSSFIPADERIITIEDAAELKLSQDHVVSLETRPANIEGRGEVLIRDLVKNSLRMRPDRIVVGECRGGEALDMLQAMNTGHDGSLTTGHANTPADMLRRLETMVLMSGVDLPVRAIREQIASAVHLVVQQSRIEGGARKIVSIVKLMGIKDDQILMEEIFKYNHEEGAFKDLRPK